MGHESARNGHALLLAPRQLLRVMRQARRQPHLRQRRRRHLPRVAPAAQFQRQHDVFDGGERRDEVNDWNTNPTCLPRIAARPSSSSSVRSMPAINTRPVLGESSPASNAQQGGLARAGSPNNGQGLAGSHVEAHIGENGQGAVRACDSLGYVLRFENDLFGFGIDLILHQERS